MLQRRVGGGGKIPQNKSNRINCCVYRSATPLGIQRPPPLPNLYVAGLVDAKTMNISRTAPVPCATAAPSPLRLCRCPYVISSNHSTYFDQRADNASLICERCLPRAEAAPEVLAGSQKAGRGQSPLFSNQLICTMSLLVLLGETCSVGFGEAYRHTGTTCCRLTGQQVKNANRAWFTC